MGGQLSFRRRPVGVVFDTGFGDGEYPVSVRYITDKDFGRRIAEMRVLFIPDDGYTKPDEEGDVLPAHEQQLCDETKTSPEDWSPTVGPETGVGEEYWYDHEDGRKAYVCVDQGRIIVTVCPAKEVQH